MTFTISNQTAEISAPIYGEYTFSMSDIKHITLIDDFPRTAKIYGANGARMYIGRYHVTGYGASHVYIHRSTPPYIVIELKNSQVFLNGSTRAQTEAYFNDLQNISSK